MVITPAAMRAVALGVWLASSVTLVTGCVSPRASGVPSGPGRAPAVSPSRDYRALGVAEPKVEAATFTMADLPSWVTHDLNSHDRFGLQQACNDRLPSDASIIDANGDGWLGSANLPIIEQYVVGYDHAIAAQAVSEAEAGISCKKYKWRDTVVTEDGKFAVGDHPDAARAFGFCERVKSTRGGNEVSRCTVVYGESWIACSVRSWATDRATAISVVNSVWPAIRRSCST